jgi:cytidine deaminase
MNHPPFLSWLFDAARKAAQAAYAPYSKFHVGAALLLPDDRIVLGCNVENSSFGLPICAERTAAVRAISDGEAHWLALAVVSPTGVTPCGACRQFLAEFEPNLPIWYGFLDESRPIAGPVGLSELLPAAMRFSE